MIDIRNDSGQGLQLTAGQRLLTESNAGWRADETLPPSGFSYPIKFPLSAQNQRFLGLAYHPAAALPHQQLLVSVRYNGHFYRNAQLTYRLTEGQGDGTLRFDGGEVVADLKKLTLQQLCADPIPLRGSGPNSDQGTVPGRMRTVAAAAPGTFPFTFFPLRNTAFFSAEDAGKVPRFRAQPYVNAWAGGTFQTDVPGGATGSPAVPFFFVSWVLEQIMGRCGYRLAGDWAAHADTRALVILNLTSLRDAGFEGQQIFPADHLPAMSCADFLKALRQQFGLVYAYNATTRTCTIRAFRAVASHSPVQNLQPYLTGAWGVEEVDNKGVQVEEGRDTADELFQMPGPRGRPIQTARAARQLGTPAEGASTSLPISTTQQVWELNSHKNRWLVPTVQQPGNAQGTAYLASDRARDVEGKLRTTLPLRLLRYRGMQPDSMGQPYPLAQAGVRNARGEVMGDTGLNLIGATGLWERQLLAYARFRQQTRPVAVAVRLPVAVLARLELSRPVGLNLDNAGNTRYLLDRIRAESPGDDGLCACKLDLLTLPVSLAEGNTPVGQPVWLEVLLTPLPETKTTYQPGVQTIEQQAVARVRVWADRNRTQPVPTLPVPISVGVRVVKQMTMPTTAVSVVEEPAYLEYVTVYEVRTDGQTLATVPLLFRQTAQSNIVLTLIVRTYTYQADPGDDYTLL